MGAPPNDRSRSDEDGPEQRWPAMFDAVLDADPELMAAFAQLRAVPWRRGALEPKVKELIGVAINAATTTLYEPALRAHIRGAVEFGATREEIVEVYELASVLGIHACTMGMPILRQELEQAGVLGATELTDRQREVKQRFLAGRGGWPEFLDDMLLLDVDIVEAYLAYSSVPWKKGHLAPKVKEFIYIAIDAQTTHLYDTGTRLHIGNALATGATKDEIIEVLEVVSMIGMHACTAGIPIMLDELGRVGRVGARGRAAASTPSTPSTPA